ncbi:MAG: TonB-dependent receptor [Lewinellaceae bacterium]|nr:TonB-dependent receptor [Lewinellaceae bacterium]
MRLRLLFPLLIFPLLLSAQTDSASLLLPLERLVDSNILFKNEGLLKRQAVSATRSLEDLENLPFTVWVISSEDILRNGYVTLGDVLRAAPGVRVSQPGNALEGETFMLRGLSGNQYMKVLINDVPVRPTGAPGMPIGAQLPIRQAERIEVLYGPAAAIYGDGACAGVVNIILKESERPIYTQADLSFGNFGYNSLDLMLGGKLFRDKNIFRFSVYGSSTVRERADYFYDDNLFQPQNYLPFGLDPTLYRNNPNYRPREMGDSVARTAPILHESRLLGINLTWRGIHFNYNRMSRFDHSGLGISPLAISYANPSNRIAEQVETLAFSFQKKRAKRTATNTLSIIRYQVQNSSSFTPVFDRLSTALYAAKAPQIQSDAARIAVLSNIYGRYSSDERYLAANGVDVRFESRVNAALKPNLHLDAGLQANLGGGVPPMGYFQGPVEVRIFGEPRDTLGPPPFRAGSDGNLDLNTFAQLQYRTKKTTIILGAALNLPLDNSIAAAPRLAIKYRVDSTWALRATYSEGFQRPSLFARAHTYRINAQDTVSALPVLLEYEMGRDITWLNQTERVRAAEVAVRSITGRFATDIIFFYQEAHRLSRNGYLTQTGTDWTYGYRNAPGLAMAVWGLQGTFGNDLLNIDIRRKDLKGSEVKARGEYFFQYSRGREWFGYGQEATRDVRNFPRWIGQFRLLLYSQKWEFMVSTNRQASILGSASRYQEQYQRAVITDRYPDYRTWDTMLRLYLSKNFLVYVHIRNLFNRRHAGIDATGTPDDLLYNPQPGRMLRFGVNYNMD